MQWRIFENAPEGMFDVEEFEPPIVDGLQPLEFGAEATDVNHVIEAIAMEPVQAPPHVLMEQNKVVKTPEEEMEEEFKHIKKYADEEAQKEKVKLRITLKERHDLPGLTPKEKNRFRSRREAAVSRKKTEVYMDYLEKALKDQILRRIRLQRRFDKKRERELF